MTNNMRRGTAIVALLMALGWLWGCTPAASPQSYTLVAELVPIANGGNIVAAVIDVNGGGCNVRVVTLASDKAWLPACRVVKDQSAYKSFKIAGQDVDLGEVNGNFRILDAPLPRIPVAAGTRSGVAAATTGSPEFPDTWDVEPYPGRLKLAGQNLGFMITRALLTINGSEGTLDVSYKTTYTSLHLSCTVTTDQDGDFNLTFDPASLQQIAGRGTYSVQLISEGQSIAGNTWDADVFSTWQPALPPRWVRVSD